MTKYSQTCLKGSPKGRTTFINGSNNLRVVTVKVLKQLLLRN